jgi:acyl-CoA dehydrogenase
MRRIMTEQVLDGSGLKMQRERFRAWLADESSALEPYRTRRPLSLEDEVEHQRGLVRLLYDAGWSRLGWPSWCGGADGGPLLRALMYDELFVAGIDVPEAFSLLETLGPVLVKFAPDLAKWLLPRYLAGDELWGQGFSEPDAGSDLASLRTRAVPTGDGYVVTGQKVWTTLGQVASRAMVLLRTGPADSRHRGLSMLMIDLDQPGVTVRAIRSANGRNEFAEMFFDEVLVPGDRLIGEENGGWAVAMYLLQFERGMYAWERQAMLHTKLQRAIRAAPPSVPDEVAGTIGAAYAGLTSLRARARETVQRLDAGENPGPEISIDKALLSGSEQAVLDAIRRLVWPDLEIDDSPASDLWRADWYYSRVTSIFGGAVEVQRDIIGERVLGLPRGRG